MRKFELKTPVKYLPPDAGTASSRVSKTDPNISTKSGALDREFDYKFNPGVGKGTASSRVVVTKPNKSDAPSGPAKPLRRSVKAMNDDSDGIGSTNVSTSKPIRKRS
jgi:hypothetical protein